MTTQSKGKALLVLVGIVCLSYAIHHSLTGFYLPKAPLLFSLETIYRFFGVASLIIVGILYFLPIRFKDNLGFVFIWLTLSKMGITYWFFYPLIAAQSYSGSVEKTHVFLVFLWFLTIETIFSSRFLNNSQ